MYTLEKIEDEIKSFFNEHPFNEFMLREDPETDVVDLFLKDGDTLYQAKTKFITDKDCVCLDINGSTKITRFKNFFNEKTPVLFIVEDAFNFEKAPEDNIVVIYDKETGERVSELDKPFWLNNTLHPKQKMIYFNDFAFINEIEEMEKSDLEKNIELFLRLKKNTAFKNFYFGSFEFENYHANIPNPKVKSSIEHQFDKGFYTNRTIDFKEEKNYLGTLNSVAFNMSLGDESKTFTCYEEDESIDETIVSYRRKSCSKLFRPMKTDYINQGIESFWFCFGHLIDENKKEIKERFLKLSTKEEMSYEAWRIVNKIGYKEPQLSKEVLDFIDSIDNSIEEKVGVILFLFKRSHTLRTPNKEHFRRHFELVFSAQDDLKKRVTEMVQENMPSREMMKTLFSEAIDKCPSAFLSLKHTVGMKDSVQSSI